MYWRVEYRLTMYHSDQSIAGIEIRKSDPLFSAREAKGYFQSMKENDGRPWRLFEPLAIYYYEEGEESMSPAYQPVEIWDEDIHGKPSPFDIF